MTTHTSDATTMELDASSAAPRGAVIARPGDGTAVRAFGNEILFKLSSEQTGGTLNVGLATAMPGSRVPPHVHGREDEMFIIVEGTYRVWIDGAWSVAGPGTLVYLPRGVPHTFEVVSETPGKHWVLTTPG